MEPELTPILQDLAAGRIDAAEARRRIDAVEHGAAPEPDAGVVEGELVEVEMMDAEGDGHADPAPAEHTGPTSAEAPTGQTQSTASWAAIARELFGAATDLAQSAAQGASQGTAKGAGHTPTHDGHHAAAAPEVPEMAAEPVAPEGSTQRIRVRATGRRVRIVADPSIALVAADGPHVMRRSGQVLEVTSDGELGESLGGFSMLRGPLAGGLLGGGLDALRNLGVDDLRDIGLGKELLLRVNPSVPVDVEVTAGSLTTAGVPALGRVRVTAGGARLDGLRQVSDALVQAGSVTASGDFDRGRSQVRVESGNLVVRLGEGADVTVHADVQLGRIAWPGGDARLDEYQAGDGNGRLDLAVVMGQATVHHPSSDDDIPDTGTPATDTHDDVEGQER